MQVIHFTEGATDPLQGFGAQSARFVSLAEGGGDTHLSCLYLDAGARIDRPSTSHDCALLLVHGQVIFAAESGLRLDLSAGVGVVLKAGEYYRLESARGGILLLVESAVLAATEGGLSTPSRILGQRWPGEPDGRGGTHGYPSGETLSGSVEPSLPARAEQAGET